MKRSIQIAFLALVVASLTGCTSTKGYFLDRRRDAGDIFTANVGTGYGAKARVGFLQTGLLSNTDVAGLRAGSLFGPSGSSEFELGPIGLITVPIIYFMPAFGATGTKTYRNYNTGRDQFTVGGTSQARGKEIDSWSSTLIVTHDSLPHLTQIEVVVGVCGSIRLGFNPGELLDFILGWTTIDIYGDDLEARKRREGIEPKPDGDGLKPAP